MIFSSWSDDDWARMERIQEAQREAVNDTRRETFQECLVDESKVRGGRAINDHIIKVAAFHGIKLNLSKTGRKSG